MLRTAIAAAAVLTLAGAAQANEYEVQISQQLAAVSGSLADNGYTLQDVTYGTATAGETQTVELELTEGSNYAIVGVCDTDCSDLDMTMFDENGNEVSSDLLADDAPVVEVTPAWTGPYSISVTMFNCSNEPCYFGLGLYQQ